MRLIVQGCGLAIVALICFTLSGIRFWQEYQLHEHLIVVQARITDVSQPRVRHTYSRKWQRSAQYSLQRQMSFEFTAPDGGVHHLRLQVPIDYASAHHRGEIVPLRVNAVDLTQAEIRPDGYAMGGLFWGIAGFSAAALSILSFGAAYSGFLERARAAAPQLARPKAQLRRVYWRS